ncbi:MAG: polyprenyl synthetase family protein [Deltaproteobacteria bacterium]|nr:polyprenyl synthetase family protein [Candidatus Anaeroferrophillus wilburensis]MBN2888170.1 polyprenyl synthetase family protein [Deltaproteobacteria bacterium]
MIASYLSRQAGLFENYLKEQCSLAGTAADNAAILKEAMTYSLLAGGKRLRPVLTMGACELFSREVEKVFPLAVAVEMIHTYSLIHDDLPAMDDDNFRRGRPTNHKVYGEGIAILAGDALLTDAFGLVAAMDSIDERVRCELVFRLSRAAGSEGMVAGQAIDLACEGRQDVSAELLFDLHRRKTGELITFSVVAGGLVGGAGQEDLSRLENYGKAIGLAFQIADDILDETATSEQMGKDAGSDRQKQKLTSVSLLGLDESRRLLAELVAEAVVSLNPYGDRSRRLQQIAHYIADRNN